MRRIRPSRSSYRRRRWRPWMLLALALTVIALVVALLGWAQAEPPTRVVEISTSTTGLHRLDGKPVSLSELETRLGALHSGKPVFAAIVTMPTKDGKAGMPSPEVEALLARLKISWMARADIALAKDASSPEQLPVAP